MGRPNEGQEAGLDARINVGALGGTGGIYAIAVDETGAMPMNIQLPGSGQCTTLKFRNYYQDGVTASNGSSDVFVDRVNDTTWHVYTPDDGGSTAECTRPNGETVPITLAASFTIEET